MDYELVHNEAQNRFEYHIDGYIAYIQYELADDKYHITHTIVPKELGGRGIATLLTKDVLEKIKAEGKKVVAQCSFTVGYKEKGKALSEVIE